MIKTLISSLVILTSVLAFSTISTNAAGYKLSAVLECVISRDLNDDGATDVYTAVWGYKNYDPVAGNIQTIPVGPNNYFNSGANLYNPGTTPAVTEFVSYEPGRAVNAFSTNFNSGNLVWTVKGGDGFGRTATASTTSKACSVNTAAMFPFDITK